MAFQILASDKIVKLNDFALLGQVQSVDWNPTLNTQEIFELGRTDRIDASQELETSGSFEVLSIGGTAGILARMILTRTAGDFTGYRYDFAVNQANGYTITQDDLKECVFDLVMNERSDGVNFDRSTVLPRCFLTTIAGRADAGGNATETFNFGGDFAFVAPAPYHDIRAIPATKTTGSTATLADIAVTSTTHGLAYFYVDEKRLTTDNTDPVYVTLGLAGVVTITGGLVLSGKERLSAIVYDKTSPTTTFPAVTQRQTPDFFVSGYKASLYIAPTTPTAPVASEQWLKVQSIDWSIDMRVEPLRQIAFNAAGTSIYCRVPTLPFRITANVSSYESDWLDWKRMLDPTVKPFGGTGTDFYGETFDFAPASFKNNFAIVIEYYTKTGTKMQAWRFTDMKVEGLGSRVNVGGRAEVTWNFSGTAFSLQGYNI